MKKDFLRIFALTTLISLAGCASGGETNYPEIRGNTVQDSEAHYVSNTLHDVNVAPGFFKLVSDGNTSHKIIHPENDKGIRAANFIHDQIRLATGADLEMEAYDGSYKYMPGDKIISLGIDDIFEAAGIGKTTKDIGNAGYQIATKDGSIFIHCNSDHGYFYASDCLLKNLIGFKKISKDITVYDNDGPNITIPTMDIVEAPDIAYRIASNFMDSETIYQMGFLTPGEAIYMKGEVNNYHSSCLWLGAYEYGKDHPDWYRQPINYENSPSGTGSNQICYTAHGNAEEYDLMVKTLADKMIAAIKADKESATFSFTIMDNTNMCMCDSCVESTIENGAESGAVVIFMNKVDDLVQAYLDEEAAKTNSAKREVNLSFFAYNRTEAPCVHKDDSGNWVPNNEKVVCNDHVVPFIAPISANYVDSFYHENNRDLRDTFDGWDAISKKIHLWIYETNFSYYMYPFNSYSTMIETYRYCVSKGAELIYNEGQHNQPAVTAFGRFKDYLDSVSQFNVNLEYEDIVDEFFSNYFKEADKPMRQMFYEIQDHMNYLALNYPSDIGGGIYQRIGQSNFWPKSLLDRWIGLCDEAYEAIQDYATSDPALYSILRKNITLESLFPRYALIEHHSGKFTTTEINLMADRFEADCRALNVKMHSESGDIYDRITSWRS